MFSKRVLKFMKEVISANVKENWVFGRIRSNLDIIYSN
jgi:hypothetical protein